MTKRQAKRLVLALNAVYLLDGAETSCLTEILSEKDIGIYFGVQTKIALSWLKEAKIDYDFDDCSAEGLIKKILSEK